MLCDDQLTSFYRPRPASELPKLQHLSTTEPARKQVTKLQVQVPKRNLNCPKCGLTQLGKRLVGSQMKRLHITYITIYPAFLSVSSETQHPTSCLGRAITFASFAVKKIYTYYISFNISQAWYSSKNHLTLDVQ